ncbi:DNA-directed RNA polymerase subunit alpha [Patescibacteria group bacterium]|nr:DNA-directed RNA polymerase subunit alpha [Patescibacteria group bacterium]
MAQALDLKLIVKTDELADNFGKFSIQPLERGYGITIGNALRRVLMTSIPGAAITNVRIDGVLHEFSTIDNVRDDVADILMNLKAVRFKLEDNNPDKVNIKLKGKHTFTAKDIQDASNQFKVLNPDHYITEINENGKMDIELRIGIGKGYTASEENILANAPVDYLSLDSMFNPVTKVTFTVTPLPGEKESLEVLNIDVTTDGSISPKDAISYSASVIIDNLKFIQAISQPEVLEMTEQVDEETVTIRKLLASTIDEMELSVRSYNCLQAAGIKNIVDLVQIEENAMLKYKNFGRKSLTELIEKLDEMGLHFGMDINQYTKEEA